MTKQKKLHKQISIAFRRSNNETYSYTHSLLLPPPLLSKLCSLHLKARKSKAVCIHGHCLEEEGSLCQPHRAASGSWQQPHTPVCINNATPLWWTQKLSQDKPGEKGATLYSSLVPTFPPGCAEKWSQQRYGGREGAARGQNSARISPNQNSLLFTEHILN